MRKLLLLFAFFVSCTIYAQQGNHYYYSYMQYDSDCEGAEYYNEGEIYSRFDLIQNTLTLEIQNSLLLRVELDESWMREDKAHFRGTVSIASIKGLEGLSFTMVMDDNGDLAITIGGCLTMKLDNQKR